MTILGVLRQYGSYRRGFQFRFADDPPQFGAGLFGHDLTVLIPKFLD
jgi:hypothetical protein